MNKQDYLDLVKKQNQDLKELYSQYNLPEAEQRDLDKFIDHLSIEYATFECGRYHRSKWFKFREWLSDLINPTDY